MTKHPIVVSQWMFPTQVGHIMRSCVPLTVTGDVPDAGRSHLALWPSGSSTHSRVARAMSDGAASFAFVRG